jgi:hypothetical protein
VKAFGWARSAIVENEEILTAVLLAIQKFEAAATLNLLIGSIDQSPQEIRSIRPQEFFTAVADRNAFDADLGGAHIRAKDGEISIVIDWSRVKNAPRTTITMTVHEDWFDAQGSGDLFAQHLAKMSAASALEYQIASHISDETQKLRAVSGPRYEARPGAGIPYMPWCLTLGGSYADVIDQNALLQLGPEIVSRVDGIVLLRTSGNPLLYGTTDARIREGRVRGALGEGLFLGALGSQGPAYPAEYTVAPAQTRETWEAYARDGKVSVVPKSEA